VVATAVDESAADCWFELGVVVGPTCREDVTASVKETEYGMSVADGPDTDEAPSEGEE
jgi:hypothetical protein